MTAASIASIEASHKALGREEKKKKKVGELPPSRCLLSNHDGQLRLQVSSAVLRRSGFSTMIYKPLVLSRIRVVWLLACNAFRACHHLRQHYFTPLTYLMAVVVLKHNTLITAPLFSGRESLPLSSSSHHHQAEWEKHLVVVAIFHTSREMKEKVMGCIVARHSPDRFRSENHHFDRLFVFHLLDSRKKVKSNEGIKKIAFFNLEKKLYYRVGF